MATRKARFQKGVMRRRRPKLATVAAVKKMINRSEEKHSIDVEIDDNTPASGTGVVTLLTGVAEGDGVEGRTGSEIRLRSIHVLGTITGLTSVSAAKTCRLVLVRWNDQTDGALPTIGDIWNTDSVNALRNRDIQRSYQVVWDKTFVLPPTEIANASHKRRVDVFKRWKAARRVDYTGAGATIAATGKGHYFLVRIVDGTANWALNCRMTWTD